MILPNVDPHKLDRQRLSTSRLLDFVSEKELTLQCGFGLEDWPLVAVKELHRQRPGRLRGAGHRPGRSPSRSHESTRSPSPITATGIPPDVVDRLLDFSIRVSSREAYVAPDRGAQGNALKTIVAMPFVLDGEEGRVDIVGGGVQNEISFAVDRIAAAPGREVSRFEKIGSLVRIHWPAITSFGVDGPVPFLQDEPG